MKIRVTYHQLCGILSVEWSYRNTMDCFHGSSAFSRAVREHAVVQNGLPSLTPTTVWPVASMSHRPQQR